MPKAIVTSGPTRERIDPVRYITNDSSGKQGHAIANALSQDGFDVILISGSVNIPTPEGVKLIKVESADEMLEAVESSLPADVFVSAAAVCDWKVDRPKTHKMKKIANEDILEIKFIKTPDILKIISAHKKRPKIVVGFAAETENLIENAKNKLKSKGCDYILANDVSNGVFGSDSNTISFVERNGVESWDIMAKQKVASKLVNRILEEL